MRKKRAKHKPPKPEPTKRRKPRRPPSGVKGASVVLDGSSPGRHEITVTFARDRN
jgi:hypothetical protein